VGTISIEKSERLSALLKRKGIAHAVLNAKYHEKEAEIIAQAGRKGAVTIATNMAGRGTDILLGGNLDFLYKKFASQRPDAALETLEPDKGKIRMECEEEKKEVIGLGGLHIIGTERHESRRVDNQLRGRAGRQGDPGSSRFYLSLEDDLLRIFGSDRISKLMGRLGMEEGVPIEHRIVSRAIENAQKRVEAHNFDIRKQLLEYDDVMNKQRTVIYGRRREALSGEGIREDVQEMIEEQVDEILAAYCPEEVYAEEWDAPGFLEALSHQFSVSLSKEALGFPNVGREALKEEVIRRVQEAYRKKESEFDPTMMRRLETMVFLRMIDSHWKDHLLGMDYLKEGIGLRGYGQKDPLSEYKREGFEMFSAMIDRIKRDAVSHLFRVQVMKQGGGRQAEESAPIAGLFPKAQQMQLNRGESEPVRTVHREGKKIGRNDLCPCGSGKKYKKCHGQ
ncbi:MAG TPA: SEC-C metal-binding domain-containing protein, partial [Candidatus Manganitrophaceae bacterium]|nr:SEC-C metal-binding domain-containing protein [Candidatus Manganitrophaceae bacterium]